MRAGLKRCLEIHRVAKSSIIFKLKSSMTGGSKSDLTSEINKSDNIPPVGSGAVCVFVKNV